MTAVALTVERLHRRLVALVLLLLLAQNCNWTLKGQVGVELSAFGGAVELLAGAAKLLRQVSALNQPVHVQAIVERDWN